MTDITYPEVRQALAERGILKRECDTCLSTGSRERFDKQKLWAMQESMGEPDFSKYPSWGYPPEKLMVQASCEEDYDDSIPGEWDECDGSGFFPAEVDLGRLMREAAEKGVWFFVQSNIATPFSAHSWNRLGDNPTKTPIFFDTPEEAACSAVLAALEAQEARS